MDAYRLHDIANINSLKIILKQGNCDGIRCPECFFKSHPTECDVIYPESGTFNPFRVRVFVAKCLAGLKAEGVSID